MKRVLISAYRCDPDGVSEAYSGFRSVVSLAARRPVTLCTPSFNIATVRRWLEDNSDAIPDGNLRLIEVPMSDIDRRLGGVGSALKPGFFLYSRRLRRLLCRLDMGEVAVVWHRTPVSFRFRTSLHRVGIPLMIGPVSGGLHAPAELRTYFRGEGFLYRLRALDRILLGSEYWMRPFDRATRVLVSGEYVRELLPARLASRMRVLLETAIDRTEISEPFDRDPASFQVLYVGRLARYKAPGLAVDAFARFLVNAGMPAAPHLTIVGAGPEMRRVAEQVARHGIPGRVTLLGPLPRQRVRALYVASDIFLFPSITEAAGNVYLEAMAASLPLVVVAHGGGAGIPSEECAIKVPISGYDGMVEALAAGLGRLWADPGLREAMGRAGREQVGREYTWDAAADRMNELVDEVIAERG